MAASGFEPLSRRERGRGEGANTRGVGDCAKSVPSPAPSGCPLPKGEGFRNWCGENRMKPITATNDFVVKFAKCILRMGVPVSPRNIFPSNIQGLPTWYEVRVSEQGWLGRRGGYDLLVA